MTTAWQLDQFLIQQYEATGPKDFNQLKGLPGMCQALQAQRRRRKLWAMPNADHEVITSSHTPFYWKIKPAQNFALPHLMTLLM